MLRGVMTDLFDPVRPVDLAYRRWAIVQSELPDSDDGWSHLTDEDRALLRGLIAADDPHAKCLFVVDPRTYKQGLDEGPFPPGLEAPPPMSLLDFARFCHPIVIHDPETCADLDGWMVRQKTRARQA